MRPAACTRPELEWRALLPRGNAFMTKIADDPEAPSTNPSPSPTSAESRPKRLRRGDILAALVCVFVGVVLNGLPNAIWWAKSGDPTWLNFHPDEIIYTSIASHAYHNHPFYLSDVVRDGKGAS